MTNTRQERPRGSASAVDVAGYLASLRHKGDEGLERGAIASAARALTTPQSRFRAKLYATTLLAPYSRRKARSLQASSSPLHLNVGSGRRQIEGWYNIDLIGMGTHVPWNITHTLPFAPGTADAVFFEHVLEHFLAEESYHLLEEAHRVLKPGGVVRVGVPDFGAYLHSYVGDGSFIAANRPGRPTPLLAVAEVITCHGHRSVWDGDTLVSVMTAAGFADCRVAAFGASRLDPAPDTPERELESVYVEGVKTA